jgi:hypothetical protein
MGPDDRQPTGWALVVTVTERRRRLEQAVSGDNALTLGNLAAELPPPPLTRVQPGAVGGPIQPHPPASGGANDGFHLSLRLGIGLLPRHREDARGRLGNQGLPPCGDLLAPLAAAAQHDGCACMLVDGAQTIALVRVPWGGILTC